ncbi:hypothetical protein RBY4I_1080 [Rhodobacterales bacterium Y4I]|nr:hypothetical protein RBY4I_1080 [Rhodobacterales bacterium Y4I]
MGAQMNESGRACHAATLSYCRSRVNGRSARRTPGKTGAVAGVFYPFC